MAHFNLSSFVLMLTTSLIAHGQSKFDYVRGATGKVLEVTSIATGSKNSALLLQQRPEEVALRFAREAIEPITRSSAGSEADFDVLRVTEDSLGKTHVVLRQLCDHVPVFGATVLVHIGTNGTADGATLATVPIDCPALVPKLSLGDASQWVLEKWRNLGRNPRIDSSELSVVPLIVVQTSASSEAAVLAWVITVSQEMPFLKGTLFLDATTGAVLHEVDESPRAVNRSIRDCSYADGSCYAGFYSYLWGYWFGRSEGDPARGVNPVVKYYTGWSTFDTDNAYSGIGAAHLYFQQKFGRDGANSQGGLGDGVTIPAAASVVWTYIEGAGYTGCPNAFYNGSSLSFCAGMTGSDTIGHEYGHAVTANSIPGGLLYQGESGAISESYSDVFGEAIERFWMGSNDWALGTGTALAVWGNYIRSMSDPTAVGSPPSPDRYYSPYFFCGAADNGGIHVNNGPVNKAAYLMAVGGSFNGCEIVGIGQDRQEAIFYRALTTYLPSAATFNHMALALVRSCLDLYPADYCLQVSRAVHATELVQAGPCTGAPQAETGCASLTDSCPGDINKIIPGQCGCGVVDADSDGDGAPDCADACPGDPGKTSPLICGCGVSDVDLNGNSSPDCTDIQLRSVLPGRPKVKAMKRGFQISMAPREGVTYRIEVQLPTKVKGKAQKKYWSSSLPVGLIKGLKSGTTVTVRYRYYLPGSPPILSENSGPSKVKIK